MLLAISFTVNAVSAADIFDASGGVIFINIPLGGEVSSRPPPSVGFDLDMPSNKPRRAGFQGGSRREPLVPLEIELSDHGPYRVKVGGFYLDSLN